MTEPGIPTAARNRLTSIDMLRGLVLVIMALDHVRDMVTRPQSTDFGAAMDFASSSGALFFTRFITHLCAPTFILLAGVSAFLYGAMRQRSTVDVSRFLLSRGVWLVFVELTLINFAWAFNLHTMHILQVIWAIGISMILLACLVWLPLKVIGAFGLIMVVSHNGLDAVQPLFSEASPLWVLLHMSGMIKIGNSDVYVIYPLVPWIGVMALGYAIGPYFLSHNPGRPKRLIQIGTLMVVAFILLRLTNLYGDPLKWALQESVLATLISFLNVTKYPPSLQFLLLTLGGALVLLGLFERFTSSKLITIGRVPFFFYTVHFYLIHTIAVFIGLWQGFSVRDIAVFFIYYPAGFGLSLGGAYIVWVIVILAVYPLCVWFAGVKARRNDWWLKYL